MATSYDDYMAQIAQNRQDVGQRIAGLPQFETSLREQVYGQEQAVPSLRGQISDKVAALYDADKRMADTYANPGSQMFMRDPYQREKYISTQHQAELGTIGDLQNLLASRQDVLGSAIEKGLQIYQAGIEASKFQQESLLAELDAAMKVASAKRAAAGSGSSTPKYKYTDLVALLQQNGQLDTSKYPNLRTDEGFLTWLKANPTADYEAAQAYLPDLVAYPSSSGGMTSAQQISATTAANLNKAISAISTITPELIRQTNPPMDMTDIQRIVADIDPNILTNAQAWNRVEQAANTVGIY